MKPDISAVLFIDDCYIDILPILSLFFISFVMVHFIIMIYRFSQSEYCTSSLVTLGWVLAGLGRIISYFAGSEVT